MQSQESKDIAAEKVGVAEVELADGLSDVKCPQTMCGPAVRSQGTEALKQARTGLADLLPWSIRRGFEERPPSHCQWIEGEGQPGDCLRPTQAGSSYCAEHHQRVFVKPARDTNKATGTSKQQEKGGRMANKPRRKVGKGRSVPAIPFDELYRRQHQIIEKKEGMGESGGAREVSLNVTESPLGWLLHRKHITPEQFDAGEALRKDFELSGMSPKVTRDYARTVRSSKSSGSEPYVRNLDAKKRFQSAIDAAGREFEDVLVRIVCCLDGLADFEKEQGWPVRSGKVVLGLALNRLARHYGLIR